LVPNALIPRRVYPTTSNRTGAADANASAPVAVGHNGGYKFTADRGNLIGWGEPLRRIDANRFYDLGSGVITFDNENGAMRASLRIPGELCFLRHDCSSAPGWLSSVAIYMAICRGRTYARLWVRTISSGSRISRR